METTSSPLHNDEPSKGAKVDCKDLCYSVMYNGKMKRILKNCSFSLDPGDLCALMGPSGAGKSTLMDLVAARKLVGTWSGDVYIDDHPRSTLFARDIAYVLQDDVHNALLTVEETIGYAAWVRLPEGTPLTVRQERVNDLLDMMGLLHVRDSRVGDAMTKGISGGQLKRLSIAVEIVALPKLIFLDEPTSGLDSAIAFEVMHTVRNFVSKDHTCITTIHQPSIEVFELFDKLVLLSSGRLIYFGAAADAKVYFTQPEIGYSFEDGRNPAEFAIEVACGQRLPEGSRVAKQPEELEILYKSSRFYRPTTLATSAEQRASSTGRLENDTIVGVDARLHATGMLTQLQMLMHRSWTCKIRNVPDFIASACLSVGGGLLFGIVFYQFGDVSAPFYEDGTETSDTSAVNSLLFVLTIFTMIANLGGIPYLYSQRVLFRRELAANAYGSAPYWLSSLITLTPIQLAYHFVLVTIVYWMVGFNSSGETFFYFLITLFVGSLLAYLVACSLAAYSRSEVEALMIFPAQFLFFTTFMGFTIRLEDVPVYWSWAPYICYPRWVFEGLMVNEWKQYDTDDYSGDQQDGYGDILDEYSFDDFDKADVIWITLIFGVLFAAVFYGGLLPPSNLLVRVNDANDVVTFVSNQPASKTGSIVSKNSSHQGGKTRSKMGKSLDGDLRSNLMDDAENLEQAMVVEDPLLEYEPKPSVESFRISSGVVDRAQGCHLVFKDVRYTVTSKHDNETQIELLKGVTGRVQPGEMCALMGASGAGKSTLLDVLAQRKNVGIIDGTITYNGKAEMVSASYVMQDNVHMGILTVRESIYYSAQLRLNEKMTDEMRERRVNKIIAMLGLEKVADSILGTHEVRGISGGQLKRVSIGVEIVNLPNLMFLDEPTTGLDSSIALEVMSAVRNLANQNRTVICTIHQPSADTYALFDSLLLLSEGRVIYFGPAVKITTYFSSSPFGFVYKEGSNPAEFLVAVAGGFIKASDGRDVSGGELATYYNTTEQCTAASTNVDPPALGIVDAPPPPAVTENPLSKHSAELDKEPEGSRFKTSFSHQLLVLLSRRFLVMKKDFMPVVGPIMREFIVGMFYGSVWFQMDTGSDCDESSCYTDRLSLIFFSLMLMFMGQMDTISYVVDDRLVFYRERGSKAYGAKAYWVSLWLPWIPVLAVNVLAYSMVMYPMCGMREGFEHWLIFYFFMLFASYASMFLAFAIAAISKTTQVALTYFPVILIFNFLYAGYMVYIPAMDEWQKVWLPYLSIFRYAFQGMVLNEFQHNSGNLPESQDYINDLGFGIISIGGCFAILVLITCIFATAHFLAIKYIDFEER